MGLEEPACAASARVGVPALTTPATAAAPPRASASASAASASTPAPAAATAAAAATASTAAVDSVAPTSLGESAGRGAS